LIRDADNEARRKFDTDLNEPLGGWTLRLIQDEEG
jgi:hypothetical protein